MYVCTLYTIHITLFNRNIEDSNILDGVQVQPRTLSADPCFFDRSEVLEKLEQADKTSFLETVERLWGPRGQVPILHVATRVPKKIIFIHKLYNI